MRMIMEEFSFLANVLDLTMRILYYQSNSLKDIDYSLTSTKNSVISLLNIIDGIKSEKVDEVKQQLKDISRRLSEAEEDIKERKDIQKSLDKQIEEEAEKTKERKPSIYWSPYENNNRTTD
jgi:gas vesicle protein